jgi:putative transposase
MLISIPPKYSVSHIVGFLKGKTAIYVANKCARKRRYKGYHFWARGYFVSTTGDNEQVVRRSIRNQEKGECQEFRVRACIMGTKEITHGTTERSDYPG